MVNSNDKTQAQLDLWCSAPGITFTSREAEENYRKRTKRIADAILLKKPDRVPIMPMWEYFYATYSGESCFDVLYNHEKATRAAKKTITELEPDAYQAPTFFCVGQLLDALDSKDLRWPGHGIGLNHGHQYVEAEHMKADEYGDFLNDPSDFMLRKYMPRVCGNLKAFESLSPFRNFFTYSTVYPSLFPFGTPEIAESIRKLVEAGEASVNYIKFLESFRREMAGLGFPAWAGSAALAPFDAIATTLRGTHGTALDMYRQPGALKAACEKFVGILVENAVFGAKMSGIPIVFMPLNKGTATSRDGKGGFMSPKQFEEFYWPTLKKMISGLVANGLVPNLFFEGDFTSRLEIIKDVPQGTCIYHFETVDIQKAKKILGGHVCFRGSVPIRSLVLGTPQEVRDSCKELIDVLGDGGGFIMDAAMASEDVKPENMRAMIEFTKEYGVYNK
jgi:uroporphyrinogen-III decarboxylase